MWPRLLRWLLPLGLLLLVFLPRAQAQAKTAPVESGGSHVGEVVLSYVLAIVGTLVVAAILCTPSRKRSRE